MGRGRKILIFLAGEDINTDQVDLGVAVLSSLRSGHFHNLARTVLDNDVAVLPQRRALLREGGRGTGIGAVEADLMLSNRFHISS